MCENAFENSPTFHRCKVLLSLIITTTIIIIQCPSLKINIFFNFSTSMKNTLDKKKEKIFNWIYLHKVYQLLTFTWKKTYTFPVYIQSRDDVCLQLIRFLYLLYCYANYIPVIESMDNFFGGGNFINTNFYTANDSCYFWSSTMGSKKEITSCSAQLFKLSSFTSLLQKSSG